MYDLDRRHQRPLERRRLASILGAHFLEVEGENLVAAERGSTYVFVGLDRRTRIGRVLVPFTGGALDSGTRSSSIAS
jgi:hypothetical protein